MGFGKLFLFSVLAAAVAAAIAEIPTTDFWIAVFVGGYLFARERMHFHHNLDQRGRR